MACVEVSSGARPRENGLTSTQVCGKDQLGQPWKKELNFFPFSGLHRTLVRKLNLVLMERGTALEPATSTLGADQALVPPVGRRPRAT